jgi:nitroimidazol reductase NimA-like FMN-containing flavoprotein (pyridoxamine 5'-phosphate oxidase superfamily)
MRDYSNASPTSYQRRPDYKRGDDWIKAFLRRSQIAHLSHAAGDHLFVTPTNFWYDEAGHQIIFHSNRTGRLRSDLERSPRVCLETSEVGRFLPSNAALEFSVQFRSVMVFGTVRILDVVEERRTALTSLLAKYFPHLRPGIEFRPITDKELARTSVYALKIEAWSGKENWHEQADMTREWPPLPSHLL